MNSQKFLAIMAIAAAVVGCCLTGRARSPKWDDEADSRRAAYIFMEAQRQNALDNTDSYFDLLRQACRLDTADTSMAFDLGYYQLRLSPDSASMANSFGLMTRHFRAHPDDYYGAMIYAIVAQSIDYIPAAVAAWEVIDSLRPNTPAYMMRYAKALSMMGDSASLRKSISVISQIEQMQGPSIDWTAGKMQTYYLLGDTAAIFREAHRLIASGPDDPEHYLLMGDLQELYGSRDSAEYYFNRACDADSTYGRAIYRRAAFYGEQGDSTAFDAEVFHALSLPTLDIDAKIAILHNYVSKLYNDSTRQPQIISLFDQLVEQHPHEKDLRELYAGYLMVVDDIPGAIEQTKSCVELDPADERSWGLVSSLYAQIDDLPNAVDYAKQGLHYHPDAFGLNRLAGVFLYEMGLYDEAVTYILKALEVAINQKPQEISHLYNILGEIHFRLGHLEEMQQSFKSAMAADPAEIVTLNNYAYFLALADVDLERAEKMIHECVMVDPENPTYLDTYAWVAYKLGDLERAIEFIKKAIKYDDPDNTTEEIFEHADEIRQKAGPLWDEIEIDSETNKTTTD